MRNARTADVTGGGDPQDGRMAATAPSPARTPAGEDLAHLFGRGALCVGVLGLALGTWCRSFVEGTGGPFGITLAQLGAPWVVVAFVVGALVAVRRPDDRAVEWAGLAVGGLAGAGTMVVASFSYYGEASSFAAVFWATAGLFVGGAAGVAGAAWRSRPGGAVEAAAAGALGLALVAEGIGRLDFGWFHTAGEAAQLGAGWLVLGGLALPLVLTRGRLAGALASLCVLLLAAPVAAVVVLSSHRLGLA
jgi:hypothetical protein